MAEIVSWEAAEVELKVLCAAYIIQIWFERVFILGRRGMQCCIWSVDRRW